jgi:hypothetical protein
MTIYSLKFIILMDHPILLQFIPQQFTNYLNFLVHNFKRSSHFHY